MEKDNIVETRAITKQEAEACAREQVQYIGAIQPHGFLLVVDPIDMRIVQHSKNLLELLNTTLSSPLDSTTPVLSTFLTDWLELASAEPFDNLVTKNMQLFNFGSEGRISNQYWECLGVIVDQYISLEFFPATSKLDSYDLLINLDRMVTRIRASSSQQELFNILVQAFQKHADYDRVMLYRFLPDWSGEVVAEAVSEKAEVKFLGLRFPAEDIPEQARELYRKSTLRIMADVDAEPSPLVPQRLPSGQAFDQSVSVLRSMSKMHVSYLNNMGVKASMSIALLSNDKLWGLVAFHHYSAKVPPNHLVSEMKASCELFADIVISHLHPTINLENIQRTVANKRFIENSFKDLAQRGYDLKLLAQVLPEIQSINPKSYIGVCIDEQCFVAGGSWQGSAAFAIALSNLLNTASVNELAATNLLSEECELKLSAAPDMAGVLAIKSRHLPEVSVFIGAPEVSQEITWGGKPHTVNIVIKDGERQLEPRSSFALWRQKVIGHSDPWSHEDRELLYAFLNAVEEYMLHCKKELMRLKLYQSSYNDDLTGLPNRRYLEEHFAKLAENKPQSPLVSVFFLDLDNFKRVNDFLGHIAGDQLLKRVAERLKDCVRPDDLVVRLGGDEFVVVVQHTSSDIDTNQKTASHIGKKIIHSIGQPVFDREQPIITTPSIGAVICSPQDQPFGEVLQHADIAMYRAKNAGKNQVHFFSTEDQNQVNREVQLEMDLRLALEQGEIKVHFQPKVGQDKSIIGAEALARWHHKDLGFVSPEVFVPLAEKNNLIGALGDQILNLSCRQVAEWRKQRLLNEGASVSVNVSPLQLLRPGFEDETRAVIERYGLAMSDISLEITETLFMENFESANKVLQSLQTTGMRISLDDFGTGYSSLSYLWKLPIDEVKIDRSFVENMNESDESLAMVEGIISLCNKLKLDVVAEGVEEKVQVALLRGLGCRVYQGYYFGKPVSAESFSFEVRAS